MGDLIYYTYVYLDPRKKGLFKYGKYEFEYEPIYVGKGKFFRYRMHLWKRSNKNKILNGKINRIKEELNCEPIIIFLKRDIAEIEAYNIEAEVILSVGRIVANTGPLTNISVGGVAGSHGKRGPQSIELLTRLTAMRRLKPPRLGKTNSPSMKKKQREAKLGKKFSELHKLNLSLAKKKDLKTIERLAEYAKNRKAICESKPPKYEVISTNGSALYPSIQQIARTYSIDASVLRKKLKSSNSITHKSYSSITPQTYIINVLQTVTHSFIPQ